MLEVHEIGRCVHHQSGEWFQVSINFAQTKTECKISSITPIGVRNEIFIDEIGDLSVFTGVNPRFILYGPGLKEEGYYRKEVVFNQTENEYLLFETKETLPASYFLTTDLRKAEILKSNKRPQVPNDLKQSNDSDALKPFALKEHHSSSQPFLNLPDELSPTRIGSALKGSSPKRSSSNLKVHFEDQNAEKSKGNELAKQNFGQDDIHTAHFVRQPNASQSLSLWSIASESLLGKWSILVLFLGLVGLFFAAYGTSLFYGSSVMAIAGAVGYGISLFQASLEASQANQTHLNGLRI